MTLNPRVGLYLSILGVIIGVFANLSHDQIVAMFGAAGGGFVSAWAPALMTMLLGVNGILHMIPAADTPAAAQKFMLGPSAPAVPPAAKAVVLFVVLAIGALALAIPAEAQQPPRRPALTGNLPADIGAALHPTTPVLTGNLEKDIKAVWDKIVAASSADLKYASALANAAGTAPSKQRKQCWDAILAANEQANGSTLKNADGTPMVKPDPSFFSNVEIFAETVDNLSPQGQLFTSCAGAAEMAKMSVLQFVAAAVGGVATFTAVP